MCPQTHAQSGARGLFKICVRGHWRELCTGTQRLRRRRISSNLPIRDRGEERARRRRTQEVLRRTLHRGLGGGCPPRCPRVSPLLRAPTPVQQQPLQQQQASCMCWRWGSTTQPNIGQQGRSGCWKLMLEEPQQPNDWQQQQLPAAVPLCGEAATTAVEPKPEREAAGDNYGCCKMEIASNERTVTTTKTGAAATLTVTATATTAPAVPQCGEAGAAEAGARTCWREWGGCCCGCSWGGDDQTQEDPGTNKHSSLQTSDKEEDKERTTTLWVTRLPEDRIDQGQGQGQVHLAGAQGEEEEGGEQQPNHWLQLQPQAQQGCLLLQPPTPDPPNYNWDPQFREGIQGSKETRDESRRESHSAPAENQHVQMDPIKIRIRKWSRRNRQTGEEIDHSRSPDQPQPHRDNSKPGQEISIGRSSSREERMWEGAWEEGTGAAQGWEGGRNRTGML